MLYNIGCQTLQTFVIAQDDLHSAHSLLTCSDVGFSSSFLGTLPVVGVYLLHFLCLESYLGNAWDIPDVSCDAICNSLPHRIAVNNLPEDLNRVVNRRPRKAHKGSIGKSRTK